DHAEQVDDAFADLFRVGHGDEGIAEPVVDVVKRPIPRRAVAPGTVEKLLTRYTAGEINKASARLLAAGNRRATGATRAAGVRRNCACTPPAAFPGGRLRRRARLRCPSDPRSSVE